MKEIVEYTDYRKFIQDYYDERKRCSAFSWHAFAQKAGFSSDVYLKYVCEGKKNLSVGSAGSVANAMGLVGFEYDYFVLMVSYAHAKSDGEKRAAFEERCAMARAHKMRVLGDEEFNYFKSWKNSVIRELAPHMPGAKPLEMARACKQKISATEAHLWIADSSKKGPTRWSFDRRNAYFDSDDGNEFWPVRCVKNK